nr:sulfotransferase [uncultured Parasphingorhabdus sp.]
MILPQNRDMSVHSQDQAAACIVGVPYVHMISTLYSGGVIMQSARMASLLKFGAQHDPAQTIRTHLFVISPNNSGSTFLRRSFEFSDKVWWLPREGQHVPGYVGPFTRDSHDSLTWNASADSRARYCDPSVYDWQRTRKAWYFLARSYGVDASVFVTSSPPFLLNMDVLDQQFDDARFILLTRDPYAVAEGILRRPIEQRLAVGDNKYQLVARHIGHCFRWQLRNRANRQVNSIWLTYESMTDDPVGTAARIRQFMPMIDDYALDQPIPVKNRYFETARNMNGDAFSRLQPHAIDDLRAGFADFSDEIEALGYAWRGLF